MNYIHYLSQQKLSKIGQKLIKNFLAIIIFEKFLVILGNFCLKTNAVGEIIIHRTLNYELRITNASLIKKPDC